MRINIELLEKQGYSIEVDEKFIEIIPQHFRDHQEALAALDTFNMEEVFKLEILETIHEYEVLTAIRRTRG